HLPGAHADHRHHAPLHPEDRRASARPGALRPVDAGASHHLHHHALPEPARLRALTMTVPDPTLWLLVLARVAGLVLAAPVLGHLLVPVRVRMALAAILAAALVPAVGAAPFTPPADLWSLGGMVAAESALGVLLGLVAQFIFAGVQLGGQLAGIQMGFGIANLIDPQSHAQVTIIAQWQQLMTLLAFLVLDAHHLLIRALLESFRTAPPGAVGLAAAGVGRAIELAGSLFVLGARIAAPVLIVLLLTNGQVALSPEVAPVAVLLAALALASWGAPAALARSRTALAGLLAASGPVAAHDDPVGPLIVRTLLAFGGLLAPFCLAAAVVGAGAVVAQVGWSVNPELLLPDPGRISPSNGLKRIFSANGAMNLVKAVAKIAVVATVAYRVLLRTGAEA